MDIKKEVIKSNEVGLKGSLAAAFLCIIFGSNTAAIKVSLTGLGVFTNMVARFVLSAVVLTVWAILTKKSFALTKTQFIQICVLGLMFTVQISLFNLGLDATYASRAALIVNLQPFFVLVLAHFFIANDGFSLRKLVGTMLGFGGVTILFVGENQFASSFLFGEIMILASTVIWASTTVFMKRIIHSFQPFQLALYPMVVACPFFILEAVLFDAVRVKQLNMEVIAAVLYQGVMSGAMGFVGWNTLIKSYGAVAINSFIFVVPIAGVISASVILGETISFNIILSLIVVCIGVMVVQLPIEIGQNQQPRQ